MTQSWQLPWLLQQGEGFNTQRDLTLEFGGLSRLCLKQELCPCWFVASVGASLDRFVSQTLTKCYLYIQRFLLQIQHPEDRILNLWELCGVTRDTPRACLGLLGMK